MALIWKVAVLMHVALVLVWAQDDGGFDGGSFGGFDGGDSGGGFSGGFSGGFGGGDDGGSFVGGGGDGGFDGSFDGTAVRPVYAPAPESITGPGVVLTRRRRSASEPVPAPAVAESHRRVRRGGYGVVGPVHTYVRTDYDGNFKWGARHHVGKSYGGGHGGGYGHY